jgi:hypothetical protein
MMSVEQVLAHPDPPLPAGAQRRMGERVLQARRDETGSAPAGHPQGDLAIPALWHANL